jgi:hypothetical protein
MMPFPISQNPFLPIVPPPRSRQRQRQRGRGKLWPPFDLSLLDAAGKLRQKQRKPKKPRAPIKVDKPEDVPPVPVEERKNLAEIKDDELTAGDNCLDDAGDRLDTQSFSVKFDW